MTGFFLFVMNLYFLILGECDRCTASVFPLMILGLAHAINTILKVILVSKIISDPQKIPIALQLLMIF